MNGSLRGCIRVVSFSWLALVLVSCDPHASNSAAPIAAKPAPTVRHGVTLADIPMPYLERQEEGIQERFRALHQYLDYALEQSSTRANLLKAYLQLGRTYHAHDYFDAAKVCYENADRIEPNQLECVYSLARLEMERGDFVRAMEWMERALEISPDYLAARVGMGELQFSVNRHEDARRSFERALSRSPDCATALMILGKIHATHGEHERAVESFERALSAQPAADKIYYPLAQSYRKLGNDALAESLLERVGNTDPHLADPLMDRVLESEAGAYAKQRKGLAMIRAGNAARGLDLLRQATVDRPDDATLLVSYGSALTRLRKYKESRSVLTHALAVEPENHYAHLSMSKVCGLTGDLEVALEHCREALRLAPLSKKATYNLAKLLEASGKHEEALVHYRRAVELDPGSEYLRGQELKALMATGEWDTAIRRSREAMEACPESRRFALDHCRLLASCPEEALRDADRALSLARRLHAKQPDARSGHALAIALAGVGDFDAAITLLGDVIVSARGSSDAELVPELERLLSSCRTGKPPRVNHSIR